MLLVAMISLLKSKELASIILSRLAISQGKLLSR